VENALATIYTARPVGAEADELERFAVKVFHPIDLRTSGVFSSEEKTPDVLEGTSAAVQHFLDGVRIQRQLTDAKAAHWAPIHEFGPVGEDAYYVTDYYNHSAEDLMRVDLDARTLQIILDGVVKGLIELKETCGRPHGELKATNVLVSSGEDIRQTRVFLADPVPAARLEVGVAAVADIRGLGELIYQLVLHKPPHGMAGRVVQKSEAWTRLGRKGEAWRELCSQLLMSPETFGLGKLAEEMEALRVAEAPRWRGAAIGGGVAALALIGLLILLFARGKPKPPPGGKEFDLARWQQLCEDYHGWFAKFRNELTTARRAQWRADPDLQRVVNAFDDAESRRVQFDPTEITGKLGEDLIRLKKNPPPEAMTPEAVEKTANAAEVVARIKAALSPEGWSRLRKVNDRATTWVARGWKQPAQHLRAAAGAVRPSPDFAAAVDRLVEVSNSKLVEGVEASWALLAKSQEKLKASGDKVLAKFQDWVLAETRSEGEGGTEEDLKKLQEKLQGVQGLSAELAAAADDLAGGKADRERFLKESGIHATFDGTALEHTFRTRWLKEVKEYSFLRPDPRGKDEDWTKRLAKIEADIAELAKLEEGKADAERFRARLNSGVKAKIAEMWRLVPIRRDEHLLKRGIDQAMEEIQQLEGKVQGAIIVLAGDPDEWLDRTLKFEFTASAAVNAAWDRGKRAALGPIKKGELKNNRELYLKLRNEVGKLRKGLERLEDDLPKDLPEEARKLSTRPWYGAFVKRTREKSEEAVRAAIGQAGSGNVPDLEGEAFQKAWQEARQKLLRWREDAAKVIVAYGAIEAGLDGCYLSDEKLDPSGKSLGEIYEEASRSPVLAAEDELRRALEPISQRVHALREVQALKDRAALVSRGLSATSGEVALAAWRGLGRLADAAWPASADEVAQEVRIRQRAVSELRALRDQARRESLQRELARGGAERQSRWLAGYLDGLRKTLDGAEDPILAGFGKHVDGLLAAREDPEALLKKLEALKPLAEGMASVVQRDWEKKVARDLFAKESQVHREFAASKAVLPKAFEDWLKEVKEYYYLPDDDPLVQRSRALEDVEKSTLKALENLGKRGERERQEAARLLERFTKEVEPRGQLAAVSKNKAALAARVAAADTALKEIKEAIGEYGAVIALEGEVMELAQAPEASGDKVLGRFKGYLDAELKGTEAGGLPARKAKLNELKALAARLSNFVRGDWAASKVHVELFAKESQVHRDLGAAKPVSAKTFDDWLTEVKDYYYLGDADPVARRSQALDAEEKRVRDAIAELEKRGEKERQAAAMLAERLKKDVEPRGQVAPVAKNKAELATRVTNAEKALKEIRDGIGIYGEIIAIEGQIGESAKAIEGAGDSVLASFGALVKAESEAAAQAEPQARRDRLDDLKAFAARVEAVVKGDWAGKKIHRELFAKESEVHRQFAQAKAVSRKTFEDWLKEAKDYTYLDADPRGKKEEWAAKVQDVSALIERVEKLGGDYKQKAADYRGALEQVRAQTIGPLWPVEGVRKNQEKLAALVGAANAKLDELRGRIVTAFEKEPQWRELIAKRDQVASSEILNAEWRKRRDDLLKAYTSQLLGASTELYLSVRGKFEGLETFLKGVDDPKGLPVPPENWPAPLAEEAKKARDRALQKAVAAVRWEAGFPAQSVEEFKQGEAWRKVSDEYSQSLVVVSRVQENGALLRELLAGGYRPDDKPDEAPATIRSILDAWQKQAVSQELLKPFDQTVAQGRELLAIEGMDRQQLAERAKSIKEGDPPQVPMLVWTALGKQADWPGSPAELEREATLREQVAAAKAKAAKPDAVRWVDAELAKEGPRRWEACFNAIADRGGPKVDPDGDLRRAIELAPKLGVTPESLAPQTRFRRLLCEFRLRLPALPQNATKEDLQKEVAAFESKLIALPGGFGSQPAVAGLLKQMKDALAGPEEPGGGLDKGGPAASPVAGWTAKAAEDSKSAEYTWATKPHTLTFLRVEPRGGGGKPVYLCTTEVSLGLFIDVVAAAGKWQDVTELLNVSRLAGGIDPRKGPRTWQPTRDRSAITDTRDWLVVKPGIEPYAQDNVPAPLSRAHPMQYVSPDAALYVARLLGCRLPTSAEWGGAFDAFEKGKDDAKRNLRDATWSKQKEHVRKLREANRLADWPDADVFVSPDLKAQVKAGEEAQPVTAASDGSLWPAPAAPAPAGAGGGMRDLVGNVAELVFEDAAGFEQLFKDPAGLSAKSLRDYLTGLAAALKVVGGSALSGPEAWDGKERQFDRALGVDLEPARLGYADVGFRLAFTAPKEPLVARLSRVLKEQGYLGKAK
jgi:hypothetical protein